MKRLLIVFMFILLIPAIAYYGGPKPPAHDYVVEGQVHGSGLGYQFHCKAPYTSCGYRSSILVMLANGQHQQVAFEGALPFWHGTWYGVLHEDRRYRLHYHANPKPGEPNLMAFDGVERLQ